MIDLHHHLLPGLDDGPATLAESISAAEDAAADGVRVIAATPHLRDDHPGVRPQELASRCEDLKVELAERGIPVDVVSGGEVDLAWAQEASDEDLRLVSYGQRGSDLLLETPYGPLPSTFEALLFGIQVRGYRILLAHPERNPTFRNEPDRLAALVARGVLVQASAGALASARRNSPSRRLTLWLIERGLCHVIASDSHGPSRRRGSLSMAVAEAERKVGDVARQMVTAAPEAILAGEPVPAPGKRRSWRRRRFARSQ
jgi:protein-tyrosine phosphatase